MSKKTYQIPFNGSHMMEYTTAKEGETGSDRYLGIYTPTKWRDNKPFLAAIKLTGQYRGRSAARVKCTNIENGECYSLGLGAFYEAVVAFGVQPGGTLAGKWYFRKQGANYGLYPIIEE